MKDYITEYKWYAKFFDHNDNTITDYDVLAYRTDYIKRLKKACATKEMFAYLLNRELKRQYLSRCEYELIVELTDDKRVVLYPFFPWELAQPYMLDVTNDNSYDWVGFAKEFIAIKGVGNRAKIDIYDQLTYGNCFDNLVDYLWHTRLKYERHNDKFNY
jgi:hypothetical protein